MVEPYYMIIVGGEWVAGTPTINGQKYRYYDMWGGMIESYWFIPEEAP